MMTRNASTSCAVRRNLYRSAISARSSLVGGVTAMAISQRYEKPDLWQRSPDLAFRIRGSWATAAAAPADRGQPGGRPAATATGWRPGTSLGGRNVLVNPEEIVRVVAGLDPGEPVVVGPVAGTDPVGPLVHHEVHVRSPGGGRMQRLPVAHRPVLELGRVG